MPASALVPREFRSASESPRESGTPTMRRWLGRRISASIRGTVDSTPASATARFAAAHVIPSRASAQVTRALTMRSTLGRPRVGGMLAPPE
jgi:hypothetical protein